jgi:hypothetical protein
VLSDTNGPVKIVLSNLTPEWYHHRFNSDIRLLSKKLMGVLSARRDNARAAATSAISASALTSDAVMTPVPSAVVPYTPGAARRGRSSLGEKPNDNGPNSNKKARH